MIASCRRLLLAVLVAALTAQTVRAEERIEAGGATLTLSDGWTRSGSPELVRLSAPEADLSLYLVGIADARDGAAATMAAWKKVDPAFARHILLATPSAATEGWEERLTTRYEVPAADRLEQIAFAYRHGASWTILLASGAQATIDKRIGQISAMMETLRPAGFAAENFAGKSAHPLDAARRGALEDFWRQGMQALGIPGMGYAIVDRNGIIEEGGLGVRNLARKSAVDAHTRFMIASNTKGMTTLLLARLVDAGKLSWDEPVVSAFPSFRLGDEATRKAILIRHLVCACTGMPRQDLEWVMTGGLRTPPAHVFDLLATMKPTSRFGEVYQYSNLLASAAGYIAGQAAHPGLELGAAYDRAMREQVFGPLGMRDTALSRSVALRGNFAEPYGIGIDGRTGAGTLDKSDSIYFARPAGGAWSSAHDVALFALNELRGGVLPSGKRMVSEQALVARRLQGMQTGEATSYGMGLETTARWGVSMIHHGGSMPGYKSDWVILPEAGVGVVMLTNSDDAYPLLDATRRRLVELLYGAREEAAGSIASSAATLRADIAQLRKKLDIPPDPAIMAKLASRYESPELGSIAVKRSGKELIFDFGQFSSRMTTQKNEDGTTSFVMLDPTVIGWRIEARNTEDKLDLLMQDGQHDYVYRAARE